MRNQLDQYSIYILKDKDSKSIKLNQDIIHLYHYKYLYKSLHVLFFVFFKIPAVNRNYKSYLNCDAGQQSSMKK